MSRTPLLLKPSLEEVKLQAAKIGLPDDEAESFFYHYESNGWKVGRNPMKCWLSALSGWRVRWMQRQRERKGITGPSVLGRQITKVVKGIE